MNWRRSTRCGTSACVELALGSTAVHIRDASGDVVSVPHGAWRSFIALIKEGGLDG